MEQLVLTGMEAWVAPGRPKRPRKKRRARALLRRLEAAYARAAARGRRPRRESSPGAQLDRMRGASPGTVREGLFRWPSPQSRPRRVPLRRARVPAHVARPGGRAVAPYLGGGTYLNPVAAASLAANLLRPGRLDELLRPMQRPAPRAVCGRRIG